MKFLSNFDTDIDTKLLQHAFKEYDKKCVLLIKKHPIFLLQSLVWYVVIVVSTVLFGFLLTKTDTISTLFEIALLCVLGILLVYRLLATISRYYKYSFYFHTHINAAEELASVGTKKLDTFIRNSLFLIGCYCIVLFIFEGSQAGFGKDTVWRVSIAGGLCLFAIIVAIYQLIFIHIRYEIDFLLVTPDYVEHVYQQSFFSRKHRTVKAKQIRTIELSQDGVMQGLFHLGKAIFVTDTLDKQKDIYLSFDYIGHASEMRKRVLGLLIR